MDLNEKLRLLEEIMEMDENTLSETMLLVDIEEWDSISRLALMAEAKTRGINLTAAKIKAFQTVGDICACL